MYSRLSYFEKCLPSSFKRIAIRTIRKDFKRGLKQINKKIEVYIELPKVEKVGEGMVKVEDKEKKAVSRDLIEVDPLAVQRVENTPFNSIKRLKPK